MSSHWLSWLTPSGIRNNSRWFSKRRVKRYHVIQAAIDRLRARTYLEIGVSRGTTFERIDVAVKIGVDPIEPSEKVLRVLAGGNARYFQMTSDEFFQHHGDKFDGGVDLAFVDGLHNYAQSLRDVENCLRHLRPGGVVLMHDCYPREEAMAVPAPSREEARKMNVPGWKEQWTGDVWKTVVHLRSTRNDLKVCVLDCDFGIGVVVPVDVGPSHAGPNRAGRLLGYSADEIPELPYAELAGDPKSLLDLRHPISLGGVLDERASRAA